MRWLCLSLCAWLAACGSSGNDPGDVADALYDGAVQGDALCEPVGLACSVLSQDCPDRQGCYFSETGAQCAWAGPGTEGDACEYVNDCDAGFLCIEAGGTPTCARACSIAAGCATPCSVVCPETHGRLLDHPELGYCAANEEARPCDLLAPDCPQGQACYYANDGVACHGTTDDLPEGAPCGHANDCAGGHVCVNDVCRSVCDTTSVQCPATASHCVALPDAGDAGACLP